MKVDCCNATECPLSSVTYGDTFYLDGRLYIKVGVTDVDVVSDSFGRCLIVALDRGELRSVKEDIAVILADTKVVVNTKDSF